MQNARAIHRRVREEALVSLSETKLHEELQRLFQQMDPQAIVEVTHGSDEYGKDLVMVREDQFVQSVIGIVVKKGTIRGQTKGKIDEIQSQVRQAIAHPAKLSTMTKSLAVTQVWVIIAGEFAGNAKSRLKREVAQDTNFRSVKIFDIRWLVDRFTEFYPQVFFEGEIFDFIQKKIQQLETQHLFSDRGKTLSESFVSPLITPIDIYSSVKEPALKQEVASIATNLKNRKKSHIQLKSLIKGNKRVILAGEPGTGKSLALAKLVIDLLRQASTAALRRTKKKPVEIPLFLSAKDLVRIDSCEVLIRHQFPHKESVEHYNIITLVVDALDEAPLDEHKKLLDKAAAFSEQLHCSLLISTRKVDILKSIPSGFEKYELLPFNLEQAIELFRKFAKNSQMLDALKEGVKRTQSQLIMTPLSLLMLIKIVEEYDEVPASITELYEQYSDTVLGRYDKDKGIEVLFEHVIKKHFLATLAFKEFYEKDRLEIAQDEFSLFVSDYSKNYGIRSRLNESNLEYFIKEIERSGILHCGEHVVTFCHRSFLDYFAARYIFDNREQFFAIEDLIVSTYFNDIWSDIAFFYSGLRKELTVSIVKKIQAYHDNTLACSVYKFMSGKLLQAAWFSPQEAKLFGVEEIIKLVPYIQEELVKLIQQARVGIPEIAAIMLVIFLSDLTLRSSFLAQEVLANFKRLQEEPREANKLYMMLTSLWVLQDYLPKDELNAMVKKMIELSKKPEFSFYDESATLIILSAIENTDKAVMKSITRRLKKLDRNSRNRVLPRQKGYRRNQFTKSGGWSPYQ